MMKQLLKSLFLISSLILCALLMANTAYGQIYRFKPGKLRLNLDFEYFDTTANFEEEGGTFVDLDSGSGYAISTLNTELHYEMSRKINFISGFRFSSAESDDGEFKRNNSQVTDLWLGGQYLAYSKKFQIIPEAKISFPLTTFDENTDTVLLNEGVIQASFGSWAQTQFFRMLAYTYLGFRFRDDGRSHLAEYRLGAIKRWGRFYLGGEALGYMSVTDDEFTNDSAQRTVVNANVNGGSLHFYGVNPEKLSAHAWGGYRISKDFLFKLGYKKDLNGKSNSSGYAILASLEIRNLYNVNQTSIVEKKQKERVEQEFVPDTDEAEEKAEEYFLEKEVEVKLEKQTKKKKKKKKRKKKK